VTDSFTRIEASGVDQLKVVCGSDKRGLELHGESNILPEIESRVDDNGTMHIGFKSGSYQPNSPVAATLFMDAPLRELELSGSTAGTVENVHSGKLNIDLSGSSSATVKGQAEDLNLDISGSARFDGQWLIAQDASVDASGASNARVQAKGDLDIDASGASNVAYSGSPTLDKSISGAASVRDLDSGKSYGPDHGGNFTSISINGGNIRVSGNHTVVMGDITGGTFNL
jgi:hypothetical protein